jgi:hypothetical protein
MRSSVPDGNARCGNAKYIPEPPTSNGFLEEDDSIQTVIFDGAYKALGESVEIRGSRRKLQRFDAIFLESSQEI